MRQESLNVNVSNSTVKDEMYLLFRGQGYHLNVHVNKLNNLVRSMALISLPAIDQADDFNSCNVSNCLYLLSIKSPNSSLFRISKDITHQY